MGVTSFVSNMWSSNDNKRPLSAEADSLGYKQRSVRDVRVWTAHGRLRSSNYRSLKVFRSSSERCGQRRAWKFLFKGRQAVLWKRVSSKQRGRYRYSCFKRRVSTDVYGGCGWGILTSCIMSVGLSPWIYCDLVLFQSKVR